MYTKRYPRTMQQAFGPFTNNVLYPMPDPQITPWWIRVLQNLFGATE